MLHNSVLANSSISQLFVSWANNEPRKNVLTSTDNDRMLTEVNSACALVISNISASLCFVLFCWIDKRTERKSSSISAESSKHYWGPMLPLPAADDLFRNALLGHNGTDVTNQSSWSISFASRVRKTTRQSETWKKRGGAHLTVSFIALYSASFLHCISCTLSTES